MKPVLVVHGYSSEGKKKETAAIYGSLPDDLRGWLGKENVQELDLSRWISLNDGICLDDVSFAMDRALRSKDFAGLPESGFNVIIHSTGALVVRNWIRLFSPKPSPVQNLIHLAGANFGSGLAHIGQGQLARWGRVLTAGTGCGYRILNELEFGSWKTIDLHLHFLRDGNRMYEDYGVREFCLIGSQIPPVQRAVPIRYVHEDSSDGTVRTAAGNLNFNYVKVEPSAAALDMDCKVLRAQTERRLDNRLVSPAYYRISAQQLSDDPARSPVPFTVLYETAHYGDKNGILNGTGNREKLGLLIRKIFGEEDNPPPYAALSGEFRLAADEVFRKAALLKAGIGDWNPQEQYEGHAQLIFRLRDQQGSPVEHFDVYLSSAPDGQDKNRLEGMIEDRHINKKDKGTITFYLRTQEFDQKLENPWKDLLEQVAPLTLEITGEEPLSRDIRYVPLTVKLSPDEIRRMIRSFQTTIVDVTLLRLPSAEVFEISPAR